MKFSTTIAICVPVFLFIAGRLSAVEEMLQAKSFSECFALGKIYRSVSPDRQLGLEFESKTISSGREPDTETTVFYFDPTNGVRQEKLLTFFGNTLLSIQWDGNRPLFYGPYNFDFEDKVALSKRGIEPDVVSTSTRPFLDLPSSARGYSLSADECGLFCRLSHAIFLPC